MFRPSRGRTTTASVPLERGRATLVRLIWRSCRDAGSSSGWPWVAPCAVSGARRGTTLTCATGMRLSACCTMQESGDDDEEEEEEEEGGAALSGCSRLPGEPRTSSTKVVLVT